MFFFFAANVRGRDSREGLLCRSLRSSICGYFKGTPEMVAFLLLLDYIQACLGVRKDDATQTTTKARHTRKEGSRMRFERGLKQNHL